jgi:hypothetical protein
MRKIRPQKNLRPKRGKSERARTPRLSTLESAGGDNFEEIYAYLLELLDGSLVDTTALVDQMAGLIGMLAWEVKRNNAPRPRNRRGNIARVVLTEMSPTRDEEKLTVVDLPESTWLSLLLARCRSRSTVSSEGNIPLGDC